MIPYNDCTPKKTTRLSDDIRQIFTKVYGTDIEMIRLCRDHNAPLLFHDKSSVLDITQDEFVGIFNPNANHFFLSSFQAARFGIYCKLTIPHLIAFMLKAEWEHFIYKMSHFFSGVEMAQAEGLGDDALQRRYIKDFKPDSGKIYKIISKYDNNSLPLLTFGQVDFFVIEFLKSSTFLMENEQIGQLYPDKAITEEIILSGLIPAQREAYFQSKELWKHKSIELDEMLLNLERRKRLNIGTENKYFRHFGDLEAEKAKYLNRLKFFNLILKLKHDQPTLSRRKIKKLAMSLISEDEKKRKEIENKIRRSRTSIEEIIPGGIMTEISSECKSAYEAECKNLLRNLFRLLHSDSCPNYSSLSGKKKKEINELWLDLMKSTKGELFSFSPSMLLYSFPDYQQLLSIYEKACLILGKDPECLDIGNRLDFMIRNGAPIIALLDFLKSETELMELHLANLELIQNEYTNEDQTQHYREALENVTLFSEKLEGEVARLKIRLKETEYIISSQFKTTIRQ